MKTMMAFLALLLFHGATIAQQTKPLQIKGSFMDDYGIRYTINDSTWAQLPKAKYHIIKWNVQEQYIIAQNDTANKTDKGLFTRIDYMAFENMPPYTWGFCLTVYDAATKQDAENSPPANKTNPRKGCGGYPFSRMKKVE